MRYVAHARVSRLCGFVAAALIALGVLVVCEMVFVRYVLNQNTIWQTDFVTYSLVAATFIGSPYVLMTRGHVNVDVLPHYLGPRTRCWLALFASIVMRSPSASCSPCSPASFWHGGVGATLGLGHHVARAAVDSVRVDADRPRRCSRCSTSPTCLRSSTGPRAAVRHRTERAHEPDHAGRARARRHADRAALGRAGRVRPGRALDRVHRASSRASTRCTWSPRRSTPG